MESPVLRARVPAPLRERVQAAADLRGVTVSAFVRQALVDRVHAVEVLEAAGLKAQARQMADQLRADGDHRAATVVDYLLLSLATAEAMAGTS